MTAKERLQKAEAEAREAAAKIRTELGVVEIKGDSLLHRVADSEYSALIVLAYTLVAMCVGILIGKVI